MLPNINLLPKYERQSSVFLVVILGFFIIWLLLLSFFIYQYLDSKGKIENNQVRSEELNIEKVSLESKLAEQAANQKGTLEDAVNLAEKHVLPTSVLIHELIRHLPDNGYLSRYSYSNGEVKIETQFEELNDGAAYITKLVDSHNIKDARIDEVVTFQHSINHAKLEENAYQIVPRYNIVYSLEVNRQSLREELKRNE